MKEAHVTEVQFAWADVTAVCATEVPVTETPVTEATVTEALVTGRPARQAIGPEACFDKQMCAACGPGGLPQLRPRCARTYAIRVLCWDNNILE